MKIANTNYKYKLQIQITNINCRYIFGTDKLRPNAFEVRGMDGSNTGKYH